MDAKHEKLIFDNSKVRGRIVEKFGTVSRFAEHIGEHQSEVSAKLNNRRRITKDDVYNWGTELEIPECYWKEYFFTLKV